MQILIFPDKRKKQIRGSSYQTIYGQQKKQGAIAHA